MAIINLYGSVWSDGKSSVFLMIVTNLATDRAYYLESDEDETIKVCLDSKRYKTGVSSLRDKYNIKIERLSAYEYVKDGTFNESFDTSTPGQSVKEFSRLCNYFGDDCVSQLIAIWKTLLEDVSPIRSRTYQIQTKNSSLGTW